MTQRGAAQGPACRASDVRACVARPVTRAAPGHCPRCGEPLAWRHDERDPAHVGVAHRGRDPLRAGQLSPGAGHATRSCRSQSDTILSGVVYLYESGSWPLALIVFVASVADPARQDPGARLRAGHGAAAARLASERQRTRLYRIVEFIGRWSMLDVFVDTFIVALVQLSPLMSVEPGPGVVYFMAVVVLTMFAAESFDPRSYGIGEPPRSLRSLPPRGPAFLGAALRNRARTRWPEPDDDDLPEAVAVPPRRARFSPIWIVPIVAALVAIGIAGAALRRAKGRRSPSRSRPPTASRPARRSSSTRRSTSAR